MRLGPLVCWFGIHIIKINGRDMERIKMKIVIKILCAVDIF
jgi:hypothetical protein